MHSKQWYYSLHRDFQNCYSTQRSLTRFFSSNYNSNSTRVPIQHPSTYNLHVHTTSTSREFSIQKSNSTCRRQRALRVLLLHTEGKETFNPVSRNSTHRRQGDLLEIHPCVLQDLPVTFQAFQPQVLTKATPVTPVTPVTPIAPETFQTFQSFMTSSLSRQFYNVPVFPGIPPHSSILRLECIFYIFYNFYSSIGFHRKLHRVPVEQIQTLHYRHYILQRKGDVVISVKRASVKMSR